MVMCIYISALGKCSQVDPWGWLASHLSLIGGTRPVRDSVSNNKKTKVPKV